MDHWQEFSRSSLADIPARVAHELATGREVFLGTDDLPKSETAPPCLVLDRSRLPEAAQLDQNNGFRFPGPAGRQRTLFVPVRLHSFPR